VIRILAQEFIFSHLLSFLFSIFIDKPFFLRCFWRRAPSPFIEPVSAFFNLLGGFESYRREGFYPLFNG
jgi:hypothetical protein